MNKITFNVMDREVMNTAEEIGILKLSKVDISIILQMVEFDEMLAKDIHQSIKGSITEVCISKI